MLIDDKRPTSATRSHVSAAALDAAVKASLRSVGVFPFFVESLERRRLMAAATKIGAELSYLAADFAAHPPSVSVTRGVARTVRYHFSGRQPNGALIRTDSSNSVLVKAVARGNGASGLVTQLKAVGATVSARYGRVVSATVPIGSLRKLNNLSYLNFAAPAYAPVTLAGKIDDQAAAAITADSGAKKFGVDGSGVTVGILSDSFNSLGGAAGGVSTGDLPTVDVLKEGPAAGTDEGRAMAELVHDVAPGAGIAFYTAFAGQADFAAGIVKLAQPTSAGGGGARVIVDDVGYFDEPIYQDGVIAQAVNNVATTYGASYFSAAGNKARQAYESGFNAASTIVPAVGGGTQVFHDFDPGAGTDVYQPITLAAGESFAITYQWDQPYASAGGAGSASTMGAYLINAAKTQVLSSATDSRIGGDPIQILSYTNTTSASSTVYLALQRIAGSTPGAMKYISLAGGAVTNYLTNTGASFGHNQASGAIGVGAAYYLQTPAYRVSPPQLEPFSSAGGTPILFSPSGVRLATPDVRQQPAVTAVDGAATTFFGQTLSDGLQHFFGTSAAAPHAAAIAALLLQAKPSLTPSLVRGALTSTAIDMKSAGYDFDSGFGLIQAEAALRSVAGASISGVAFRDYNNDGVRNGTDPALAGRTLFIDDNGSGTANAGGLTVSSTDVPKSIADGSNGNPSRAASALVVSGLAGRVTKVTVALNVSHTRAGDLGLTLITPSGLRIPLFTNIGGGGGSATGYNLTLDDAAAGYVQNAPPAGVVSGTFSPQSVLSAVIGEKANGTWQLEARDYASGNTGTINGWSLNLTAAELTATTDSSGNYTFAGLSPSSVFGTYNVRAAAPVGLTLTTPASPYNLTLGLGQIAAGRDFGFFAPLATVASIVLEDGSVQRSNVRSITLNFTGVIVAGNIQAGAFTLTQNSGPVVQSYTANVSAVTPIGSTGTAITLTFAGPGVVSGSVADGRYTLSIDGSKLTDSTGAPPTPRGRTCPGRSALTRSTACSPTPPATRA